MAALVQTIPQQTGTAPVLQTRPSSSSGTFGSSSNQHPARFQNMSWSGFNAGNSGSYRAGHPVVAPYAFPPNPTHAPNAQQHRQSWSPHLRPEHRTFSAPTIHGPSHMAQPGATSRVANPAAGSVSTSSNSSFNSYVSKDDSVIPSRQPRADQPLRPLSTANLPPPSVMTISSPSGSVKPSPNRYRRSNQRSQSPAPAPTPVSTSASASDDQVNTASAPRPVLRSNGHNRYSSVDDSSHAERPQLEPAKRYRRRSMGTMDPGSYPNLQLQLPIPSSPQTGPYDFIAFDTNQPRPQSAHSQKGSSHSAQSSVSSTREGAAADSSSTAKPEEKRVSKPSPLSQPASTSAKSPPTESSSKAPPAASSPPTDSPAAKRLAEIKNDPKRPGKSRLRRAFSFGSASELLKASSQTKREAIAAEKARREALREELGDEQAAIAEQQEAMGLGESIYTHQGGFFSGSTDALSISSTASSASMMLRKMGKGMKKSTRSLVGLFRPKSVASINSVEGAAEPMSLPQISVVNVEAEREIVVNPDPMEMPKGGTVFPKVEPAGSEVRRSASIRERERVVSDSSQSRKSIVGGDRERAEVLAAVRKGILKKTHSDYGVSSPANALNSSDSPHSSAPPTPDESSRPSPRPTEQVTIAGEDYFLSGGGRYTSSDTKSAPMTPQSVSGRNIVFSPRIQFHETWPSGEYDRRGEIATCNRLTPLLAQQIREEINNFKMEMEVHENSKIYTHFI
ncbi:uncharacterized protein N7484_002599 [Penicillium longicatenatum]|uniref:uncharacterized protein n=1 Tax=Penicillium longicatenatum TaxID=1561947 RepID=UPI002547B8D4|nr:uncharacterized protein N7484_002599 [Penicillium longicatenatum]KAJ5648876.1 hypothetical protein N7484_002599 [Penicillium longicatenatum]